VTAVAVVRRDVLAAVNAQGGRYENLFRRAFAPCRSLTDHPLHDLRPRHGAAMRPLTTAPSADLPSVAQYPAGWLQRDFFLGACDFCARRSAQYRFIRSDTVSRSGDARGAATFYRPDGTQLAVTHPPPPGAETVRQPIAHPPFGADAIGPYTATPRWQGERLDVVWAIDVLRAGARCGLR
jgi:hypothetical protein